jgi:FAD/FMN-containing dehydrogenase
VRIAGCGHSPNDIVCTNQWMISMRHFDQVLHIDADKRTVKVECGILLTSLNHILKGNNLALPT